MRVTNWRERLERELRTAGRRRFVLGEYDCVRFTARCVDAMTDSDWLSGLPSYRNALGAWRALLTERGFARAITRRLGAPLSVIEAGCGNPVLVRDFGRRVCGICLEDDRVAVTGPFGLLYLPHSKILLEWGL